MNDQNRDAQAELNQWVTSGTAEQSISAKTLIRLTAEERPAWLDSHPEALNFHTFEELIAAVPGVVDRDPLDAGALSELIVGHLDQLRVPGFAEGALRRNHVQAWRVRGNALRNLGQDDGAFDAYQRGRTIAESDPALAPQAAALRRGIALILHYRGQSAEALAMIRADIPYFLSLGDAANVLLSKFYIASIEYEIGDNETARELFLDILEEATAQGNLMFRARAHTNLGHCTRRLGDRNAAIHHFTEALPLLRECGMTAEVVRCEWGLALLEAVKDPEGALPVLERIRAELLATGRIKDAAWVSLDAVDTLLDSGHPEQAGRLAASLYEFFR